MDNDPNRILAEALVGCSLKGKYRLDRVIGYGGMAVVYGGLHRNGKRVAIKMLLADCCEEPLVVERFVREGYAANAVDHDGVVRVDDDDVTDDGRAFLVMELLDGVSLEDLRDQHGGKLAPGFVLALGYQLLDVLVAAHAKGIIHRDIKPANLFLTKKGELKVLDFGIARFRDGNIPKTMTQMRMGTPAYAAPEQMLGNQNLVDARADLFSTGATMFHMITGKLPRDGLVHSRSLAQLVANADQTLVTLIDRSLEEKREARWPDALTMQDALVATYARIEGGPVATGKQLLEQMRRRASNPPAGLAAPVQDAAWAATVISSPRQLVKLSKQGAPEPSDDMATRVYAGRGQPEDTAATLVEPAREKRSRRQRVPASVAHGAFPKLPWGPRNRVLWLLLGALGLVIVAAVVGLVLLSAHPER